MSATAGARNRYGVARNRAVMSASTILAGECCGRSAWGTGPAASGISRSGQSASRSAANEGVGVLDRLVQGVLCGHLVEQGRLDGLEHDLVDVGLLRDRRDDVGVRRDDVLRERPRAVL